MIEASQQAPLNHNSNYPSFTTTDLLNENSDTNLPYAGSVHPKEAWYLVQNGLATLIDIRSKEELTFVGLVPNSTHIAWATGTNLTRNPRFVKEVEAKFKKDQTLLLICRSGKRSAEAATVLTKAGFQQVFNVLEGFEGNLDSNQQRGRLGGWRFHRLPWQQQ